MAQDTTIQVDMNNIFKTNITIQDSNGKVIKPTLKGQKGVCINSPLSLTASGEIIPEEEEEE